MALLASLAHLRRPQPAMTTQSTRALTDALILKNAQIVACQERSAQAEAQLFSGSCPEDNRRLLIHQLLAIDEELVELRSLRREIMDELAIQARDSQ